MFELYDELATAMDYRHVSLQTCCRLWHSHITMTKPCTDLCNTCQQFAVQNSACGTLDEAETPSTLEAYTSYVSLAKTLRDQLPGP
jgi:hypothetical protein